MDAASGPKYLSYKYVLKLDPSYSRQYDPPVCN